MWPSHVSVWRNLSNCSSLGIPDMYMKRFLKVGDACWKIVSPRLEARARHRHRDVARLGRCGDGGKQRSEARADDGDLVRIDLGPVRQPVEHRRAGSLPGRNADADAQHRALVLARTLDHEDLDAARQEAVA